MPTINQLVEAGFTPMNLILAAAVYVLWRQNTKLSAKLDEVKNMLYGCPSTTCPHRLQPPRKTGL